MPTYIQKQVTVEARQYTGDPLFVVHDAKGQMVAHEGDWLIGSERGAIDVVSDEDFKKQYELYSPTAQDDALAADKAKIAELEAAIEAVEVAYKVTDAQANELAAQVADLTSKVADSDALKLEISNLTAALKEAQEAEFKDAAKLSQIANAAKEQADAEAASQAAAKKVSDTLNS